ncbi:MAG: hypothetical protein GY708_17150 [Actinomycetia bacterium]|nr:hypothetical protein [Actinomycetes bacterium]
MSTVRTSQKSMLDQLLIQDKWKRDDLLDLGIRVIDAPLVTVGGGLGSFALADHLRVAGVPASEIVVLGPCSDPSDTYRRLASNSQIPDNERLRSDSGSTIDNIWGFPSYALREAWHDRSLTPLMKVATEPILTEYFTPRAGQVYAGVDRECDRIGWSSMFHKGWVRTIRPDRDGGYFVLFTVEKGLAVDGRRQIERIAFRCRTVHVAVGYPGLALLPDLASFRKRYPDHSHRVSNAYEPHDHVYDELSHRSSTIVIRGSGIVASRVLQRLLDDRRTLGTNTRIVHLFRHYVDGPQGDSPRFRRQGGGGFAYQPFNFPKAAWSGQLREHLEGLESSERADLINRMGGTNTAPRKAWQRQLAEAREAGVYLQRIGRVTDIEPTGSGLRIALDPSDGGSAIVEANHIVDATGLLAEMTQHRLLADLLTHCGAGQNSKGRLDVDPDFEVRGTRSGEGKMYASGAMTLGGHYAGVDSFLGLQYAALRITDQMSNDGLCRALSPGRNASGWTRWALGRPPRNRRAA